METRDVIFLRRSIRAYQEKPISDRDLQEIIEAGLAAPSAINIQPWYFVVIKSQEQIKRLTEIMGRVSNLIEPTIRERFPKYPGVVDETTKFIRQLGGAPVCILSFQLKPDYSKNSEALIQSVAAAMENIILAATDKGIGSCWITAPKEAGLGDELRDAFAPGKGTLVAMLTLGYPAQTPKVPPRKEGLYITL